jgi:hypothetical protein
MPTNNIYSALFVDFDNMYLRLRESNGKDAAESFAAQPTDWLGWLEKEMSSAHFGDDGFTRRILIRKCYLNPASFGKYRPYFTRAGFEVVDCPQLTSDGKTSTDIHMVMDIMDALHHPSNFDEFILFSADADFTPVLLRVRQHKRLSVVVSAGYSSPAYKSACDYLPMLDEFLQQALGIDQNDENEEEVEKAEIISASTSEDVLRKLAEIVAQKLSRDTIVNSYELPALYKRIDGFRESTNWLGFKSLRLLTHAVVSKQPDMKIFDDKKDGSWGIQRSISINDKPAVILPSDPSIAAADKRSTPSTKIEREVLLDRISKSIIEKVSQSPEAVLMAHLADLVKYQFSSDLAKFDGWLGAQTFKGLLQEMDLNGYKINNTIPGYVYDPNRHSTLISPSKNISGTPINNPISEDFKRKYPEIEPLAAKIHQLTDMPYLLPEHYALIVKQIARAVNDSGFQLSQTTRLVRDRCVERGAPVARSHVNFVVIGISYAGHNIGESGEPEQAETLANYLYKNTINLCQSAQMILTDEDERIIQAWLQACLSSTTEAASSG